MSTEPYSATKYAVIALLISMALIAVAVWWGWSAQPSQSSDCYVSVSEPSYTRDEIVEDWTFYCWEKAQ